MEQERPVGALWCAWCLEKTAHVSFGDLFECTVCEHETRPTRRDHDPITGEALARPETLPAFSEEQIRGARRELVECRRRLAKVTP